MPHFVHFIETKKAHFSCPSLHMLCSQDECIPLQVQTAQSCVEHSTSVLGACFPQALQRFCGQSACSQTEFLLPEVTDSIQTTFGPKNIQDKQSVHFVAVYIFPIRCIPREWTKNSIFVITALGSAHPLLRQSISSTSQLWGQDWKSHQP
jgi:hypothetical protein